jgi:pantetheine-phosphate adenylyltransferase
VRHRCLSSSVGKDVARFGGEVGHLVPPGVAEDLARLFNQSDSFRGING